MKIQRNCDVWAPYPSVLPYIVSYVRIRKYALLEEHPLGIVSMHLVVKSQTTIKNPKFYIAWGLLLVLVPRHLTASFKNKFLNVGEQFCSASSMGRAVTSDDCNLWRKRPPNTPFWNLSLYHLGDVELHISFSFLLCAPIVTNSLPSCLMVTDFKRSYQMLSLIWQAYIYFIPWAINWFVWPFFIHQTQSIPLPWNPSNLKSYTESTSLHCPMVHAK